MTRWLGIAGILALLDQAVKAWITAVFAYGDEKVVLPVFSLVRWHNEGAAFSMLQGAGGWQRWLFIILALVFTVFIVAELRQLPRSGRLMGWVYALVLGGAIGNLVDRVIHGYVVDFVLLHWGSWYFPAFNVADVALTVGAVLWLWSLIGEWVRARGEGNSS